MKTLHERLVEKVLPTLQAFHDDLLVHDKRSIEGNPGTPFLHYTRRYGTNIILLRTLESYPDEGMKEPFLFDYADRNVLLDNAIVDMARYHVDRKSEYHLFLYHDGHNGLRESSPEKMLEIAMGYARHIRACWRAQKVGVAA